MNPHWLKEHFKDKETDELKAMYLSASIFGFNVATKMIASELERREQENEQG